MGRGGGRMRTEQGPRPQPGGRRLRTEMGRGGGRMRTERWRRPQPGGRRLRIEMGRGGGANADGTMAASPPGRLAVRVLAWGAGIPHRKPGGWAYVYSPKIGM